MKQVQQALIKNITIYDVKDLDVFNIELKSKSKKDDLFYYDIESKLIHHNCLRKDFGMINEHFPQADMLMQAYKVNEFTPKFYADIIKKYFKDTKNNRIGILGYTFKANTDDIRDTLTTKLIRYLERLNIGDIYVNDPNLPYGEFNDKCNNINFDNSTIDYVIHICNIIIIAINHKEYYSLANIPELLDKKFILDGWGILGKTLIIDNRI